MNPEGESILVRSHFLLSLEGIEERIKQGPMTLGEVFEFLGTKGDEVVLIFLSLPFLQPIPIPFLSTVLGSLVCVGAFLNFRSKPPWFPQKLRNKTLNRKIALNTVRVAEKIWVRVEKILSPRWFFLSQFILFRIGNMALLISQGFLLALPLPIPFSNTIPAWAIILNAIGQLEEDGLIIILSYLVAIGSFIFFSGLVVGVENFAFHF